MHVFTLSRWRHRSLALASVCALLAACAPSPTTDARSGSSPPVESARAKKTVTVAVSVPITGFAPMNQSSSGASMVTYIELHSNGLVTSDAHGRPIPHLAKERPSLDRGTIKILDDGRMTTLWTLRDDVTWHDGTPFTVEDVVLGFRAHADPQVPFTDKTAVARIASVEALDAVSVLITWKAPFYLADSVGAKLLWPLPSHLLAEEYARGDKERFQNLPYWTTEYIHTGPFRLARFEPGGDAVFEAFDGYYLGRPKVDSVVIKQIFDGNVLLAALLAGEVDVTIGLLESDQARGLKEQWDAAGAISVVRGATFFLAFQFAPAYAGSREQLDPRIRRALYLALDRAALAGLAYSGQSEFDIEARSILPPEHPLFSSVKDVYASSAGDTRRAQQSFAEAGWTPSADGLLVNAEARRLRMEVASSPSRSNLIAAIADMWKRAGVDSSVLAQPAALAQDREYTQSYSGVELTGSGDGDRILNRIYGADIPSARNSFAGSNRGHYVNTRLNGLIDQYRSTIQIAEQGAIMREIAAAVGDDLPILLAYYNPIFGTVRQGVRALEDFSGGYVGGGYFGSFSRTAYLWEKA